MSCSLAKTIRCSKYYMFWTSLIVGGSYDFLLKFVDLERLLWNSVDFIKSGTPVAGCIGILKQDFSS